MKVEFCSAWPLVQYDNQYQRRLVESFVSRLVRRLYGGWRVSVDEIFRESVRGVVRFRPMDW